MKRSLTLTALLIIALSVAACGGGGEAQQAERAAPSQEKQTAPATQRVAKESAPQKSVLEESASRASEQGSTQEDDESPGLSVTTLDGERVNLGGQGNVTALYFMAGW